MRICAALWRGHAGADELSSEELSDLAMLATSVAARPSTLSDDDAASESLYAASNMQRSIRLQAMFAELQGEPNHVVASGPSPLGAPFVQVDTASRLPSRLTVMPACHSFTSFQLHSNSKPALVIRAESFVNMSEFCHLRSLRACNQGQARRAFVTVASWQAASSSAHAGSDQPHHDHGQAAGPHPPAPEAPPVR